MQEYLEKTRQELRLRNYSFKTIKAYLGCLREYFCIGISIIPIQARSNFAIFF